MEASIRSQLHSLGGSSGLSVITHSLGSLISLEPFCSCIVLKFWKEGLQAWVVCIAVVYASHLPIFSTHWERDSGYDPINFSVFFDWLTIFLGRLMSNKIINTKFYHQPKIWTGQSFFWPDFSIFFYYFGSQSISTRIILFGSGPLWLKNGSTMEEIQALAVASKGRCLCFCTNAETSTAKESCTSYWYHPKILLMILSTQKRDIFIVFADMVLSIRSRGKS